MLSACALTLAAFLQHPKKCFLAKNTIAKPNLKTAIEDLIPAQDNPEYHALRIRLPKSAKIGKGPWVFEGPVRAIISLRVEREGKVVVNPVLQELIHTEMTHQQGDKLEGLIVADAWFGKMQPYEFQLDKTRTGEIYVLLRGEPYIVYSMLPSWPNENVGAKEEAMKMAQYVIWTAMSTLSADKSTSKKKSPPAKIKHH